MVEMAMFNVQRAITPKVGKPVLWIMCPACHFILLYICVKFRENIPNGFNLKTSHKYMVEMVMFNVQRAITPKVGKPVLQFMCSACRLIVLYICVKFGENISDGIRVMEQTRMKEALMDRQTDGQIDTQNFRRSNIIPSWWGIKIYF